MSRVCSGRYFIPIGTVPDFIPSNARQSFIHIGESRARISLSGAKFGFIPSGVLVARLLAYWQMLQSVK